MTFGVGPQKLTYKPGKSWIKKPGFKIILHKFTSSNYSLYLRINNCSRSV